MGGTKSHKIPFWELAKGLINRYVRRWNGMESFYPIKNSSFYKSSGHNVTFLNGFPADFSFEGLVEITPTNLVHYIQNYTNWDLVGEHRIRLQLS
jgi:2-hydroxyacylsphingosine 1-beta-galactosyltransferase